MSETDKPKQQRKIGIAHQSRNQKLKEIEALYRSQIKQIYSSSKEKNTKVVVDEKQPVVETQPKPKIEKKSIINSIFTPEQPERGLIQVKSASNFNIGDSGSSSKLLLGIEGEDRARASTFLRGQSTRTIEILRKENETKELKIRELTNKCEQLISKLKKYMQPEQFIGEMQHLKQFSQDKMERLQNLFKIKNEEIFFKIKLQIITLLQEFGLAKEQLSQVNDIASQSALFSFMARKLKTRLKDFRSKEQESNFFIQKDKILTQKQDERIHYLTQTNQLLKLSQTKLKGKIDDLKVQLNEYLDKLKERQHQNEVKQSQIFRMRRQIEELNSINQKLTTAVKGSNSEKVDERRVWQAKQKEMKLLLNNYFVEKKKLQSQLQQKQGHIQEIMIKQKFLQQQNQRINRELIRWKERYEWLDRQKQIKIKQLQDDKTNLLAQFQEYKIQHNQGILMEHRSDVDEAVKKIEQYQRAYQNVLQQLQKQRRLLERAEQQSEEKLQKMQKQWLQRVKRLQKLKQQQITEIYLQTQAQQNIMREQFQQKQKLLAQQMQARMKALLAQKDKKSTQQLINLQNQNDQLRKQIQNMTKLLDVKQSYINVINSKKQIYE